MARPSDSDTHCTCGHHLTRSRADVSLEEVSEFFRIMGDGTRLRILLELEEEELCVNCIAERLGCTSSAISHQLRILKKARLVSCRKEGRSVHYSLCDQHVKNIIDTAQEHLSE